MGKKWMRAGLLGSCVVMIAGAASAQLPNSQTSDGVPQPSPPPLSPPTTDASTTAPAESNGVPNPAANVSENQLGEIVVTANKREQNLNKVGITITAVSAREIADRHITSLADVATAVPGLIYSPSTANTPIFTLRGVGFNEAALGVYPAVSVYQDQAPLNFPVMASHSAYDLERIEALKGPQGTLFGENSTGGAINYIAAKPTTDFHAGGDLTYARFNEVSGNLYVSGPVTDTMQTRVAINGEHRDNWQYSSTRDDHLGAINYFAGRWLTAWNPVGTLRLSLNVNGWVDKSDPQGLQYAVYQPDVSGVKPELTAYPFTPTKPRAADWSTGEFRPRADRRFYQIALRGDVDLGDVAQLTSITTYNHYTQKQVTDGDGYNLNNYDLAPNDGHLHSFNQEVRIANKNASAFTWVVGGNFERSITEEDQTLHFPFSHVSSPATLDIFQLSIFQHQNIRNLAGFAHAEYKFTDTLTAIGGVRYTDSRNHADICDSDSGDGRINALYNILQDLFTGRMNTPLGPGSCFSFDPATFLGGPHFLSTLHQHNTSWQGGLNYQLDPDLLLYGTVSRGYKGGSFPVVAASTTAQFQPVSQEKVTAYEAGFKATLLDRMLQLDGAGFYYDYRDKQVRGKLFDPNFGLLDLLVNVPKSRIAGGELSLTARPFRGLTMDGGVTYLSSRVRSYDGVDVLGDTQDFRGDPLPFTPKWTYSFNTEYRLEDRLPNGTPFVGATVVGRSGEDAVFDGGELTPVGSPLHPGSRVVDGIERPYRIKGYATLDLRAGYEAAGQRWRVMVFGKNVFNKYYIVNVIPGADTSARFAGQPATYGVTLAFKM